MTEKYIAGGYNTAATEAANSQLLDAFSGILRDVHQIQHEIFLEMNNRGWYQPKPANMNELNQNISKWNQDLQKAQSTAARSTAQQQQQQQQQVYQGNIPQYSYQAGMGMPQQMDLQQQMGTHQQMSTHQQAGMPHPQAMYRPPQNPMA